MNFVIPMAGNGQRFKDAGYELPKMLISAKGKTLLEWSIDSLPIKLCTNLVCIILREHEEQYNLSKKITALYGQKTKLQFHILEGVTRGQAETVYLAKHLFEQEKDLVIFNIDTYFYSDTLENVLLNNSADGILGSFNSNENRFSYAQTQKDGIVTKTAEKEVISNNALTGLYHFKKVDDFIATLEYHLINNIRVNNEFYIAPMYNYLITLGKQFKIDLVKKHSILGTPLELKQFLEQP